MTAGDVRAAELDPPADGAAVLDEVRQLLRRYVVFPADEATDAVTLYAAATYAAARISTSLPTSTASSTLALRPRRLQAAR
jgi:hypothetical protein